MQRLDHIELRNAVVLAPGQKPAARAVIGFARVGIADRRREELEETLRGTLASARNGGREHDLSASDDPAGPVIPDNDLLRRAATRNGSRGGAQADQSALRATSGVGVV